MVSFLPFSLPHEFLISRLDSKQIRVGIFQSTPVQHLARLVIHVVGLIHTPSNLTLRSPPYNELPILTTPVTRAKLPLFLRAKPRQVQQVATAPPHTNRPAAPKLEERALLQKQHTTKRFLRYSDAAKLKPYHKKTTRYYNNLLSRLQCERSGG